MGVVEKKGQASKEKKSTDELLKDSFHEFHSYLSSLLPDRENLFPEKLSDLSAEKRKTAESQSYGGVQGKKIIETVGEDCFVRFSMFKKLWDLFHGKDNKAKKEYGPDVCWHVIRSYIKGMSIDGYLEMEDYAILDQGDVNPQNESKHFRKTVTDETFAVVYDKVWSAWYEPLTNSKTGIYWDDQDLVRHLLGGEEGEGYLMPTFAGIFCDESQDFTRIELEAILRLSLFSDRKVNPNEIPLLPFVFAGDEFQTLNPTGFRWDSIKAWFTEKFIFALDLKNEMKHKVNFRTLHNNYRSSAPIVGFSNRVQWLRAARFRITDLKPQQTWNKEKDVPVVFFKKDENSFWNHKPEGTVFLVPCEDGMSVAQYIRENFNGRIELDENDTPTETVLSAIDAKGNEYECVALYGFADYCPKGLISPFTKNEFIGQSQSKEADIPLEYFLNNVYVAVTRAKKRLIIVDDFGKMENNSDYFWNAFIGKESIDESISNQLKGAAKWTEELGVMVSGNETSLDDKYDQVTTADELAKKGRSKDYPISRLLRQAATIYKRIGKEQEAIRCTAEANQIDKKYAAAAKDFKTIGEDDRVIECFWVLADKDAWKEIADFKEKVNRIEVRFSEALSERQLSNDRILAVLRETVSEISENNEKILSNPRPWSIALEALLALYAKNVKNTEQGKAALRDIKKECDKIRSKGLVFSIVSLGKAAAEIQYHEFVIQLYEQEKGSEGIAKELSLAYKKAKAGTTSYPEILDYLDKTEDKERIVELFKQNTQVQLNQQQTSTLVDVILTAGKWNLLKFLLPLLRSVELYGKILSKLPNELEELKKKCRLLQTVATLEHNPSNRQWENTLLNSNDPAVVLFITRALARSKYTEMSKDITLFLRTTFAPSKIQEVPKNYWLEVGTAIERAGRRIDALAYYEATREKSRENKSLWKELTTRLIVCKERQGKAEVGEQKPNEANRKFAEAQNLRQEIGTSQTLTIRDYLKIEWEDLYKDIAATSFVNIPASAEKAPTVPEKPTFSESEEANSKPLKTESIQNVPVQTIFAGFKIEQLDNNRIRLENIVTRDRVTIKNGKIDSPDYEISSTTGKSFLVEGANLTIDIEENGAVKIRDTSTDFILLIPLQENESV